MDSYRYEPETSLFDLPEFSQQSQLMDFPVPQKAIVASDVALPVARVLVDAPGTQWNPFYEYEVPEKLAATAHIGCRVRVPFGAGRAEGFVVGRSDRADQGRQLRPLEAVISPVPVLTEPVLRVCERLARRQACPLIDVLRLAIPARHAGAEREVTELAPPVFGASLLGTAGVWEQYDGGAQALADLRAGVPVRAGYTIAPAHSESDVLAPAIQAVLSAHSSVLIIVPTPHVAEELARDLRTVLVGEPLGVLTAEAPHAQRYQTFMSVVLGRTRVVIGTRSAAYAPLPHLGLVVIVDPGHSAHREKRSPYVDSWQVLRERADIEQCSFLELARSASLRMAQLEHTQWARSRIVVGSAWRRPLMPRIVFAQDAAFDGAPWARLPDSVFSTIRTALTVGNVLIVVPRTGYIPRVACARCGELARCPECAGALEITQPNAPAQCARCGWRAEHFHCEVCGFRNLRPVQIGSTRTALEIGKAFPGVSIVMAREAHEHHELPKKPAIVVATPGQIPHFSAPYAAAVVLDAGAMVRTAALNTPLQFFRLTMAVAARIAPRTSDGTLLIVGAVPEELAIPVREGRWRAWERTEYQEREELALPPAAAWISLEGPWEAVREFLAAARGISLRESQAAVEDHSAVEHPMEEETPLDALLTGGVHQLLAHAAVLGPTRRPDGTTLTYVRCSEHNRSWCTRIIRLTRSEIALAGKRARQVRVVVDPQL